MGSQATTRSAATSLMLFLSLALAATLARASSAADSRVLWKADTGCHRWGIGCWVPGFQGTDSTPALTKNQDRLVVGSYDGNVYCLNSTDGSELWKNSFDFGVGEGTPALVETQDCFVVAGYAEAKCLDSQTGKARWTFKPKPYPSSSSSSKIASCGAVDQERGLVFIGTLDKQIWGVHTADGSVAWRYDALGEICEPSRKHQ